MAFLHVTTFSSRPARRPRAQSLSRTEPAIFARRSTRRTPLCSVDGAPVAPPPFDASTADAPPSTVADFFVANGVSRQASAKLIVRAPSLELAGDLHVRARPILRALSDDLGLSARQTARVLTHLPDVVLRSPVDFAPCLAFLQDDARIPANRLADAIARCPHILVMDVSRALDVHRAITDAFGTALDAEALGDVLSRVPQVLVRPPSRVRRSLAWLRDDAGLADQAALARVVSAVPLALVYDVTGNLARRTGYLASLGLSTKTIGRVIAARPTILSYSMERDVKPRIAVIASVVGEQGVAAVLDKVPGLLDVDHVEDRINWLQDSVGLNDAQLASVVREAPAVLTYSIPGNLAAKWAFVQGTMGCSVADLVEAPKEILCANLQQRAVPRYAFLASQGLLEGASVIDILRGSDAVFCRNVAKCTTAVYRSYVDNDRFLLFYSQLL